jgi:cell division protein FtsB
LSKPDALGPSDSFRPVLGATVFLVLALLAIAALKSSRDLTMARSREKQLQEKIAATRQRNEGLKVRIERLQNDPGLLERLAREDLGMVRPRDVVIELPEEGAPRRAGYRAALPATPPSAATTGAVAARASVPADPGPAPAAKKPSGPPPTL